MLSWLKSHRRRKLLAQPFPDEWRAILQRNVRQYGALDEDVKRRLHDDIRIFIHDKYWELGGDWSTISIAGTPRDSDDSRRITHVTDEMKVTIAAQACLLALNISEHDHYRRVRTVLVYPDAFVAPHKRQHSNGIVSEGSVNSGEAWFRGPIIISWSGALAGGRGLTRGRNLVMHEFAHALDMMDGLINGTPLLKHKSQYARWHEVMTEEFQRLIEAANRGDPTLLNQYGATNVGEFFAVATECFFEQGPYLRQFHPHLYDVLRDYYRQDPAGTGFHDIPPTHRSASFE